MQQKILNEFLLTYLCLFRDTARWMRSQALWFAAVEKMHGSDTIVAYDWHNALHGWFLSHDDADLVGLKRNEQTFDALYRLCVLNGIPDAWLQAPPNELHHFVITL